MKFNHTTYGHKSLWTRISIVSTGVVFLVSLNALLFGIRSWRSIGITIGSGYLLWSLVRLVKYTHYTFTPEYIEIHIAGLRKPQLLTFKKEHIKHINPTTQTWRTPFGISVNPWTKDLQVTTSGNHLYSIALTNNQHIIISPKIMEKEILQHFNRSS